MDNRTIYFYKLISDYPDDVTLNCRLSVNNIDDNFYHLKSADIKEVSLSDDKSTLILTTNDGEEIVASMPYITDDTNVAKNVSVDWDPEIGKITVKWDDLDGEHEEVIEGLVTDDRAMTHVITDRTLRGDGTKEKPLVVNPVDETGFYAPVKNIIDTREGEELPSDASKGDRYLTIEEISDFGYLYNFGAVSEIETQLKDAHSEWRVPSKEDIDKLLNFAEPCEEDKNHGSEACHRYLGREAGVNLKSKEYWKEYVIEDYIDENGLVHHPLQPGGIDKYSFTILPAGVADDEGNIGFFTEKTAFWTNTHINNDPDQDIYVKIFDYRKTNVLQEADCPDVYHSLRLVKDYDGTNDYGTEEIEGATYDTILFGDINQIWTKVNISYPTQGGKLIPNNGEELQTRTVYYLNVYDGETWIKKPLKMGDTVIVTDGETPNDEIRIFVDEDGNQYQESTDDVIYERVMEQVQPQLDAEREERIETDNQLWEAINNEASARTDVDNQLWDAINQESQARTDVDNQLWDAINQESQTREQVDNQQWDAIRNEVQVREQTDNQLWTAINNESQIREQIDNQQWDAINNEAQIREQVDNQQWDTINAEIQRATDEEKRIEDQIIDNPHNKKNVNTPDEYVVNVNGNGNTNLTLFSKGGTNDIDIYIDSNYGTL